VHSILFAVLFYLVAVAGMSVALRARADKLPVPFDELACAVMIGLLRGTS
jgi:hypothetical protein